MAGVQNIVELLFRVSDQASGPSRNIASSLDGLKGAATAAAAATAAVGAGVLAVAKQAVDLGSKFEDTAINIAGNIRAFELAPTFDAATKSAADALATIEAMAAKLPGETEQYVEVFKVALPKAIESGMSDIKAITDLTSRFTAVAVSSGVDAGQAGMDLFRMLAGQAGADVRMFTSLAPHLKTTAQDFNKLTMEARRLAIDKSLGNFTEMMEAAGNTFSSKMGEAQSHLKTLVRLAGKPIFTAAVEALSNLNDYFTKNEKSVIAIGQGLATTVVNAIKMVVDNFETVVSLAKNLLELWVSFKIGVVASEITTGLFAIAGAFTAITVSATEAAAAEAAATAGLSALVGLAVGAASFAGMKYFEGKAKRGLAAPAAAAEVAPLSSAALRQLSKIQFQEMDLAKSLYGANESLEGFATLLPDFQQEVLRRIGQGYPAGSAAFREAFESHVKELGYDIAQIIPEAKFGKPKTPGGPGKTEIKFENARFDIKQNFSEGYDPDRIAAAFVDQLGAATMYRTASAFSGQPGTGG